MKRRVLAGALAATCIVVLSACGVIFDGAPVGAQRDVIGDVVITTKLCSSSEGCGAAGATGMAQSLLAYRVPAGAPAPVLTSASGLAYHADDALAQYWENTDHADGTRWYAFISDPRAIHGSDVLKWTVEAAFALPPGAPYHGPFDYKVITGQRSASEAPVDCSSFNQTGEGQPLTDCRSDLFFESVPTRDLALAPAAAARSAFRVSAQQGTTGQVPFSSTFAGSSTPDADFTLTAIAPGLGAATVSPDHFVPDTDGTRTLTVSVDVPATAAPGDYPVILTARLANGKSRSATGKLTVTPAPVVAAAPSQTPPVTISAPSTRTCLSRRTVRLTFLPHGRELRSGVVTLNGRAVKVERRGRHLTALIDLRGLPAGTATVRLRAVLANGGSVRFARLYRTCTRVAGDNKLARKPAI